MIYTDTEITLLRLCGWCKDLPVNSCFLDRESLSPLLLTELLRISRNKESIRLTEAGRNILQAIGYVYEKDNTVRSVGPRLTKRLNTANLLLFLSSAGNDVFMNTTPAETTDNSFLPSFALRRERYKNVLGTSRFSGILYFGDTAAAVYYIAPENDGLYPDAEKNTFSMNILTGGRKSAAIFTGADNLDEIIDRAANKTTKSMALPIMQAIGKFDCPVSFVPMSEQGLRQLRIMLRPDYKQRLIWSLLKKEYAPPEHRFFDGIHKPTGEHFMIGIDLDIPRMQIAAEYGVHIFLLDWQVKTAKQLLIGRKAVLHPIMTETAEELLYLSHELPQREPNPYRTGKGGFVLAPIGAVKKSRG